MTKSLYKSPIGLTYFTLEQQETFKNLSDEDNPEFTFACTNSSILSMIATGKIDARTMAWKTLANQGMDENGKWVGFDKAERIFEANVSHYETNKMIREAAYGINGKETTIKVGDKVRAWDFEPMPGREDAYVEGEFLGYSEDGRLHISVEIDVLHAPGVRMEIFTPPFGQIFFGEWNGRITKLN